MNNLSSCNIVIFGASGNLTKKKLIPALYSLYKKNMLPEKFAITGLGRTKMNHNSFRDFIRNNISNISNDFLKNVFYLMTDKNYSNLNKNISNILPNNNNFIFYLSTPPQVISYISEVLKRENLTDEKNGFARIIVEKPFGWDYDSAIEINHKLHLTFKEDQIYRIDHYLGKETVRNIFVTRFSNGIFEPLWNSRYIDHIEITSAENVGVEGRGAYYDKSGALRDMLQNHLLHILSYIAMEPPSSLDSASIHNEILKVFQSLRPLTEKSVLTDVIRGQYVKSTINGKLINGYRDEPDVANDSLTETFAALKLYIDNWRWGNVPFYIRTGKYLPTRVTEVAITYKDTPHYLFKDTQHSDNNNQIIIRIQPDEGLLLKINIKEPGSKFKLRNINMDFHYSELCNEPIPDAYEILLYDSLIGDSTLFTRADATEAAWKFLEPIQKTWQNNPQIKLYGYPAGTWGPENSDSLFEGKNNGWRYPCKNLSNDGIFCEL